MDMSSFPRMLQFKKKSLPEAQLLRWSNWFSQWKFTVKHIKGTQNILADFLSRPKAYKSGIPQDIQPVLNRSILPMVLTIEQANLPNMMPLHSQNLPEEIIEVIADLTLRERSQPNYHTFLTILLRNHGMFMKNLRFHPDYPFLNMFHIHDFYRFPKEALCFFWYLFESYTISITFNSIKLLTYVLQCQFDNLPPNSPPTSKNVFKLLKWFLPPHQWVQRLSISCKTYVMILFRRPCSFIPHIALGDHQSVIYHHPLCFIHEWFDENPANKSYELYNIRNFIGLRNCLAHANLLCPRSIPEDVMSNTNTWSADHPVSSKWIEALQQYQRTHLSQNIDTSDDGVTSEDDDDQHWDPFEDDPTHPDARWSP